MNHRRGIAGSRSLAVSSEFLSRDLRLMPNRPPPTLRIIGGNLQNGAQTIKYVSDASFTATAVYNPYTDTVYDDGLGNGYLCFPGIVNQVMVLIRHNYFGFADSLMGGNAYLFGGYSTITYGGTTMQVALIGRG